MSGPVLLALAMLFWAGSIVSGRAAAALVPPSLFTLLRWGGALVIVAPLAWPHLRHDRAALLRRWPVVVALAVLGVDAFNNLMYRGLHSTTAINALLLQSATPLFVIVALFAMFRERPTLRQVGAVMISLAGVAVIAGQGSLTVLRSLNVNGGDAVVTAAVVCYAVYSALLRLKPAVHPLSLLAASFAVGVVFLVPLAGIEAHEGARLILTPVSIFAILYSCAFPAFLAYLFYNRGVELIGPARAGQYVHLMPAFGVVLAVLFLGETLHPFHLAGIGLIGAGLWMAR
ncbi:MAG: DMT family transporter [Acetobacteraceae bacterium]|nr:DMT family transporter [Acetobacteraceae bacterium]